MKDIMEAASKLFSLGFEIFNSDRFAEFYIVKLINAQPSKHHEHYDCTIDGKRIEIKHSKLIDSSNPKADYQYFHWGRLFGLNNSKKGNVDILILSGYAYSKWYFWVVPYNKVKHHKVEYQISDRKVKSWSWLEPYFVGDENSLKEHFNGH